MRTPNPHPTSSALEDALRHNDYQGSCSTQLSDRIAVSTDNSVYQIIPDAVLRPKDPQDVVKALKTLNEPEFVHHPIVLRGGGTGTNGQSLNQAIVLELGRTFAQIRQLNLNEGWVDVDAGIILGQLNKFLASSQVFFAPTTSTANRCSIGGMIGTDAAGKGSRVYGKTSDHVLAVDVLLASGERLWLEPKSLDHIGDHETIHKLYSQIHATCSQHRKIIQRTFPRLARRLAGYDVLTALKDDGVVDPTRLICGAEGSLAVVLGARLKLTPIPKFKKLAVVAYKDFITAVASAHDLLPFEPTAIETMDAIVQKKALEGPLGKLLPQDFHGNNNSNGYSNESAADYHEQDPPICNFVEFSGDDETALAKTLRTFLAVTKNNPNITAIHIVEDAKEQVALWQARGAAAGMLADYPPGPQPTAFVEDCVVPPEHLANFLSEFRAMLDAENLTYSMFGHVDVGCMHVRPALDMSAAGAEEKLRRISDQTQRLVRKYHGLLWGEHGKGFRGEYLKETVGSEIYTVMRQIKSLFDPEGRLNPGKLAMPLKTNDSAAHIIRLDEATMRGQRNRNVPEKERTDDFADAFRCNGNAQCLNSDSTIAMCPSFKATNDLRQSPKGRADLLREWLNIKHSQDKTALQRFEAEIYPLLDSCLSCKACTSSCPVHVDIPELKSRFLYSYHQSHKRSLQDYVLCALEPLSRFISHRPQLMHFAMTNFLAQSITKSIGLVDAPPPSLPSIHKRLQKHDVRIWSPGKLASQAPKLFQGLDNVVVLLVDGFNLSFDADSLEDIYSGLQACGFSPFLVYAGSSGKAEHVKGLRRSFKRSAERHVKCLSRLKALDVPVIVAEASYFTTLSHDYKALKIEAASKLPHIQPLHRFLLDHLDIIKTNKNKISALKAIYLPHCTEKTALPDVSHAWTTIFKIFGLDLITYETGCCGMAGAFGHEKIHQDISTTLFTQNWRTPAETAVEKNYKILATGFSCRCQIKRFMAGVKVHHPLHLLSE